jgi:hypothetical protein
MPYNYRGAWDNFASYSLYDAVTHLGSLWWLPATGGWTVGGAPPGFNWQLLVSVGATGATGAASTVSGPQGETGATGPLANLSFAWDLTTSSGAALTTLSINGFSTDDIPALYHVSIDGINQHADAYALADGVLTFSEAVDAAAKVEIKRPKLI